MTHSKIIEKVCNVAPIIPVLTIARIEDARPLAQALVNGGLPALEITLRTPIAMEAIAEMVKVPGAIVGVGTLLTTQQVRDAKKLGATFGVSAGSTPSLIAAAAQCVLPLCAGAATGSAALSLLEEGCLGQLVVPAETSGGAKALAAFAAPLPQIKFCPTGGINSTNAGTYLSLPNVVCAGGSWMAPKTLMAKRAWAEITQIARLAADLRP